MLMRSSVLTSLGHVLRLLGHSAAGCPEGSVQCPDPFGVRHCLKLCNQHITKYLCVSVVSVLGPVVFRQGLGRTKPFGFSELSPVS